MTIYIILILIILLLNVFIHPDKNCIRKRRFMFLSFVLLTFISGFRGFTVGADTPQYVRAFEEAEMIQVTSSRYEPCFVLLLKVLHLFSDNPRILLITTSVFCVGVFCLFAYKYSKRAVVSVVLYITLDAFFGQMNIMRQSMALSFTMLAFMIMLTEKASPKTKVKTTIFSALLILIGIGFHKAAVVAFLPWLMMIRRDDNEEFSSLSKYRAFFWILLLSVSAFIGYIVILRVASAMLPVYLSYFSGTWSDSNYYASLIKTLISVAFLCVGIYFIKGEKLTYLQCFAIIMLGLSVIFRTLSMRMEIWDRVASMFEIYNCLVWTPEIIQSIKISENRNIVEGVILSVSFIYMIIVLIFRPEWSMVVPYDFL